MTDTQPPPTPTTPQSATTWLSYYVFTNNETNNFYILGGWSKSNPVPSEQPVSGIFNQYWSLTQSSANPSQSNILNTFNSYISSNIGETPSYNYNAILAFNYFCQGIIATYNTTYPANAIPKFFIDGNNVPENIPLENIILFLSNNKTYGAGNYNSNTTGELQPNSGIIDIFCKDVGYSIYKTSQLNSGKTEEQLLQDYRVAISNNPLFGQFCGCFAPLPQALDSLLDQPGSTQGTNHLSCDPLCMTKTENKIRRWPTTITSQNPQIPQSPQQCEENICVINDLSINITSSQDSVNFNQICECQGTQGCICIIDVTNPGILNKVTTTNGGGMSNQTVFKQHCTGDAQCYKLDNGIYTFVPCNKINTAATPNINSTPDQGLGSIPYVEKIDSSFWIFLIIIISLVIIYILIATWIEFF